MKAAAWPAPSPAGGRHRQAPLGRRQVREPAPRRATAEQVSERSARGVAPVQAPTRAADAAGRISPPCTALPFRHARIHEQFQLRRHRLTAVRHRAARTPRRPPASSPKTTSPPPQASGTGARRSGERSARGPASGRPLRVADGTSPPSRLPERPRPPACPDPPEPRPDAAGRRSPPAARFRGVRSWAAVGWWSAMHPG